MCLVNSLFTCVSTAFTVTFTPGLNKESRNEHMILTNKMKPVVQHFTNMQCQRFPCFSLCTRQVCELACTYMQKYWRLASGLWLRKPENLKSGGSTVCWGLGLEVEGCWFKTQSGQNHGARRKLPWERYLTYNELTTHPGVDGVFTHIQPSCQMAFKIQYYTPH